MSIDEEWNNFLLDTNSNNDFMDIEDNFNDVSQDIPKCSEIYISTKTKIVFLNRDIDIYKVFWSIPIIDYNDYNAGIIKKQIKISLTNNESIQELENNLLNKKNVLNKILNETKDKNDNIIKQIRKISIGISKKDLVSKKTQEKSAFYNCFVIVLRIKYNNLFKECHLKIFNTGKIEIPGLQSDNMLEIIMDNIVLILKNIYDKDINFNKDKIENILINSNFNCGFYINREQLYNILRNKYQVNAIYDPCSYPGIRCIYNLSRGNHNIKISYMIFRTGSILIVGKSNEDGLKEVYEFLKDILEKEYIYIKSPQIITNKNIKNIKVKKRYIYVT